jgi:YtcA family
LAVATSAFAALALAGCDPIVNIAGANFPAWMLCAIVGAIGAAALRLPLAAIRIEPYLGPRTVIYPSLAFLIGSAVYLIFFNRI